MTCPPVSFRIQSQLFIESRTGDPGVAMVQLQARASTFWKAGEEYLITETINDSSVTKFSEQIHQMSQLSDSVKLSC